MYYLNSIFKYFSFFLNLLCLAYLYWNDRQKKKKEYTQIIIFTWKIYLSVNLTRPDPSNTGY